MYYVLAPEAAADVRCLTDSHYRLEIARNGIYLIRADTAETIRILTSVPAGFDFTKVDSFSKRERQMFELLGEGFSMRAIARLMTVSVKTVETYRARIKVKLRLVNGVQLLRFAMEWNLLHCTTNDATLSTIPG